MKRLTIKKSFYYTAGKRYDWEKDGFSMIGVGIAKPWLVENKAILVNVDGHDYEVNCEEAIEFIRKYKAYEDIKDIRVGYISRDLMNKV